MEIPKYNELYKPLLVALEDGKIHTIKEIRDKVVAALNLSDEDRAKLLPSGRQTVFNNRLGWARTYLTKAGVIESHGRAHYSITPEGKSLIASGKEITNDLLAENSKEFAEFIEYKITPNPEPAPNPIITPQNETPLETLERVYSEINEQLAEDLLEEIMAHTPAFFENLVVDLMQKMGYGVGERTKLSGDDGIDGIIHEDQLGFDLIYIQAKRWDRNTTVTKPVIQSFAGAMMGPPKVAKGLFITTAKFSKGAQEFAEAQHIILVDGRKLAQLMIENGVGVAEQNVYKVKRKDGDYFSEE